MFRVKHHCRNRSLIPVSDLEKRDDALEHRHHHHHARTVSCATSELWDETSVPARTTTTTNREQQRNLVMIYLLFVAEAIMASSSLTSQIGVLTTPWSTGGCLTMTSSYLRGILQCAYFFGSASGIFWGFAADRWGRRRVALTGLFGLVLCCCLSMGFATTFTAFAILRGVTGAVGSAVRLSGLAMLADATHGSKKTRTQVVARLPMIFLCGQLISPLVSTAIVHFAQERWFSEPQLLGRYPGLVSQITCAAVIFAITIVEMFWLEETLPQQAPKSRRSHINVEHVAECETASFLGPSGREKDVGDALNISIIEALAREDTTTAPPSMPSRIRVSHMLTAPSILMLLASFSVLSLHSSTFDVMLPHLGHHTATSRGGIMGMSCSWLTVVMMVVVKIIAAVRIMTLVPMVVANVGLLPSYRQISVAFPLLYIVLPSMALATSVAAGTTAPWWLAGLISTIATIVKTTLTGAAQIFVLLLALSAAPDAFSTGTLLGVITISELFKALAVGLAAISYYLLSDEYSMLVVNGSLWAALAVTAVFGAALTRRLREATPRVGTDLPEECFVWEGMFDAAESDDDGY